MNDNEKKVLEALALLLDPKLQEHIQFTNDSKQNAPIRISLRDKLLPGEEETFSQTFRRLARDFPDIQTKLTDRVLQDQGKSKKSIGQRLSSARLIITAINTTDTINTDFSDISGYKEFITRKLSEYQLARLLEHVLTTWSELPGQLRRPRKLSDRHVRGYIKMRDTYSHDEIIKALQTYGRWAEAYDKAMNNGEDVKIFWFFRWDLDKLMVSNKAMDHLDGGWRELVKSKGIPEEYAQLRKAAEASKNQNRKADWIDNYTNRVIAGEDVSDDAHIAEEYADEIKTVLARKKHV